MQQTPAKRVTGTVLTLFRTHGRLLDWGDRFAAPWGLTSARWQMLGALALAGRSLTAPQIALAMGVTRQGAQKQLNTLLEDGLIARSPNPLHKRSPLYRLTGAGERIYAAIERRWNAHAEEVATAFTDGELASALRVLAKLSELHALPDGNDHDQD